MPQGNWTPISETQAALLGLSHSASARAAETVEIVTTPESYRGDVQRGLGRGDIGRLPFAGDSSIEFCGFARSDANTLTTTFNPAGGRYIGIHLDNWDRLPYRNRLQSRRRLCINAAPGPAICCSAVLTHWRSAGRSTPTTVSAIRTLRTFAPTSQLVTA